MDNNIEMMKTGIIIQARLGSTRLPNKVLKLLPINGQSAVIDQIINRAILVQNADVVIVATSDKAKDDKLFDYINLRKDVVVFRGSENNVLSRFYDAAKMHGLDHIVRLTGDNPCIDIKLIEDTITNHIDNVADYSYTQGYPLGVNVEVISFDALSRSNEKGKSILDKEHVTYFVRQHPEIFSLNYIQSDLDIPLEQLRLTMDTPEDYTTIQIIYDYIKHQNFGLKSIVDLYELHPYIFEINMDVLQKKVYEKESEELIEAERVLSNQELFRAAKIIREYRG